MRKPRTIRRIDVCNAVVACVLLGVAAGTARSQAGDAPVYALIDTLKPIAEAIVVDGADGDWAGVPSFADPAGDAGGDSSRDIVSVSIAPLDDEWLVRIETSGAPPVLELAFWLFIDYRGQQDLDLELGLYDGFDDILWAYPAGGAAIFSHWDDTDTRINTVDNLLEIGIPLASLAAHLGNTLGETQMAADLAGAAARSMLRITVIARDAGGDVDHGPAVASYRLRPTPYPLDPPLPAAGGPGTPVFLALPLEGIQYLGQGPGGMHSHAGRWAYDLYRTDDALFPSDPPDSAQNDDYYSFGDDVRAPAAGTVYSQADGNPDLPPFAFPCAGLPNWVFLDLGLDTGVLFSHLQSGSVATGPGQAVGTADLLGKVGHSGSCTWAHLHLDAQTIGPQEPFPTRPVRLLDVEVGLNPQVSDPWLRQLASWSPREGFFVRPSTAAPPTCSPQPIILDQDDSGTTGSYLSELEISAGSGFTAEASGYVHFRSGTKIVLTPGFTVESNATFAAFIDPLVDCPSGGGG